MHKKGLHFFELYSISASTCSNQFKINPHQWVQTRKHKVER
jgi:hypothetical protein